MRTKFHESHLCMVNIAVVLWGIATVIIYMALMDIFISTRAACVPAVVTG